MQGVIRTSKIGSENRLSIPDWIKDNIVYDHPLFGACIEWHFDNDTQIGVAACERLDDFTHLRRTEVINDGSNIRPPQILVDNIESFTEDEKVAIYYSEHINENMIYFLTEQKLFEEIKSNGGLFQNFL